VKFLGFPLRGTTLASCRIAPSTNWTLSPFSWASLAMALTLEQCSSLRAISRVGPGSSTPTSSIFAVNSAR
jgi:hypothetical protein